jgi:hypothetical protein
MAVGIVPNSAKISVTTKPTVKTPVVSGLAMSFTGGNIAATGEVSLSGAAGDNASGWTAGFIQAQWIETNWVYYRGQHNDDGSLFIQRGRAPARANQACRDCVDASPLNDIFYSTVAAHGETASGSAAGTAFPQKLSFRHFDQPSETCNLVETNTLTSKPNYLAEAQLEFFFCTILSVRDPAKVFHHLASFYWNQRWQATFHPTSFGVTPTFRVSTVAAGTGAAVGHVIQGTPSDKRFTSVLTSTQSQSCNQVFRAARTAVSAATSTNRHQSKVWASFDVRRP